MKTILFVLPDHLSIRNFLYTPFIEQNFKANNLKIVFVLRSPGLHQKKIKGKANIIFEEIRPQKETVLEKAKRRFVDWLYESVSYRYNRQRNSQRLKLKQAIPKEYIVSKYDVFPWHRRHPLPKSKLIYRLYYSLYNSSLFSRKRAKELIKKYQPQIVVSTNPHTPDTRSYYIEAKKTGVKTFGFSGSWDYPTTDGPVMEKIDEFIVWSRQVSKELRTLNKVKKPIHETGPLHYDYSFDSRFRWSQEELCRQLGLNQIRKLITYGVCSERLGKHEPEIASYLANKLNQLGSNYHLIIRGHPEDRTIPQRFAQALQKSNVSLCMGRLFNAPDKAVKFDDRKMLYALLKHSKIVVCGPTTLTIDAIRFETPTVNIAFDGSLKAPFYASIARQYEYDYYYPLTLHNGFYLVKNFQELNQAIKQCLQNPQALSKGMKKIIELYLSPLDGMASQRFFNILKNA